MSLDFATILVVGHFWKENMAKGSRNKKLNENPTDELNVLKKENTDLRKQLAATSNDGTVLTSIVTRSIGAVIIALAIIVASLGKFGIDYIVDDLSQDISRAEDSLGKQISDLSAKLTNMSQEDEAEKVSMSEVWAGIESKLLTIDHASATVAQEADTARELYSRVLEVIETDRVANEIREARISASEAKMESYYDRSCRLSAQNSLLDVSVLRARIPTDHKAAKFLNLITEQFQDGLLTVSGACDRRWIIANFPSTSSERLEDAAKGLALALDAQIIPRRDDPLEAFRVN